jgi:hypothetical protein
MKSFSLRYSLLTQRADQVWFPAAFWILFALVTVILNQPDKATDIARAFLGVVLPLIGGVMAAYAILDDPALELRFASPIPAARTMLDRLGITFLILAAAALSYQVFARAAGGDLAVLGSWVDVQLAWLVPTLALMAFGCLSSLAAAQTSIGAAMAGMVWIVELIAFDWLAGNIGRYALVFMGALRPAHPDLAAERIVLAGLTFALLFASWMLLHRQERFI